MLTKIKPDLPFRSWDIPPKQESPLIAHLTTHIINIKQNCAMMVTNSFSSMRLDEWHIYERLMFREADIVVTRLSWVDRAAYQTFALDLARRYAYRVYGIDIHPSELPF